MRKKQIVILILSSALIIGYTYSIDVLQALQVPLRQQPYNFTTTQFNLLYIFTFLPICFADIPIGIVLDRISISIGLTMSLILNLLGQLIFAMMLQFMPSGYFILLLIMRSIFGAAGQGNFTAQGIIVTKYCKQNYELIMSICFGVGFFFDSLDSLVTTSIYDAIHNLPLTLYIGVFVCFISLICGIILLRIISKDKRVQQQKLLEEQLNKSEQEKESIDKNQENKSIFKQLKSFNSTFWFMIAMVFFSEGSLGPFLNNLNDLIVRRFAISYADTGKLLIIPFGALSIFSVIVGKVFTQNSKIRRKSFLFSTSLYFVMMAALYFVPNQESPSTFYYFFVALFLLTMSFAFSIFYSGMCTSISYVVKQQSLGTAWGVVGTAIGLSEWVIPVLNTAIINASGDNLVQGYTNLTFFGIIWNVIPLILALWIFFGHFGILNYSLKQIQEKKKEGKTIEQLIDYYDKVDLGLIKPQ